MDVTDESPIIKNPSGKVSVCIIIFLMKNFNFKITFFSLVYWLWSKESGR